MLNENGSDLVMPVSPFGGNGGMGFGGDWGSLIVLFLIAAMFGGGYNGSYGGSYEGESDMGMSNRGRGRNAKRDSMGRYSSERGYSRNDMMDKLYEMRDNAPDDRTRQEFDRMINKMQSM